MSQAPVPRAPLSAAEIRQLWQYTTSPFRAVRRRTREVRVGNVGIGGSNPIRVQSMTISDTLDTPRLLDEIDALWRAGAELVRVTAPNRTCAEHLGVIRAAMRQRGIDVPLVADIHFTPQAAWIAAEHVEKVRINPGNFADRKHFKKWDYTDSEYEEELERLDKAFSPLVLRCKETGTAMRIGTNHGSLSDRILNRYGDTPQGMVESAIEFVRICERHDFRDIVLSMKASDVKVMVQAYRLLAARMTQVGMDYPFHLGVTEAGSGLAARVKSSIGIGSLLQDGIGDTIRVSLTEDSVHEIPVCRTLCAPFQELFRREMVTGARTDPSATDQVEDGGIDHDRVDRDAGSVPPFNPVTFARRDIVPLGVGPHRLAADWPPRIELVVPVSDTAAFEHTLTLEEPPDRILFDVDDLDTQTSLVQERCTAWQRTHPDCAIGLQVAAAQAPRSGDRLPGGVDRLSLRVTREALSTLVDRVGRGVPMPLQVVFEPDAVQATGELTDCLQALAALPTAPIALALRPSARGTLTHTWRRLLAAVPNVRLPIVLLDEDGDTGADARSTDPDRLHTALALGALLADGIGDAIQVRAGSDPGARLALAREILQATRLRLTVADFIACPSCGRTQFDLQSTSQRIQKRFRHLEGLKIAIMGCIVNGPGEMADADFGYVGSGPGRIDLYVRHERVERGIPEADAVDRLEALIREHGRWTAPAPRNPRRPLRVSS